ncbi:MAG: molybdenum cofactor guanylyltransferase [Chitinophagaceae bacterium]
MLGIVLCGGQSSRMGTDKGLLQSSAGTWAQVAANKIASLNIPVVFSVNPEQYPAYLAAFTVQQLVKDDATLDVHGPLRGLLSVHLQYPSEDLLVLACDMPLMNETILQSLMDACSGFAADAYVYSNNNEPEPLCGIYTAKGLAAVLQLYHTHQLPRYSMKYVLGQLTTHCLSLQPAQQLYFSNFNTETDLNNLQADL